MLRMNIFEYQTLLMFLLIFPFYRWETGSEVAEPGLEPRSQVPYSMLLDSKRLWFSNFTSCGFWCLRYKARPS